MNKRKIDFKKPQRPMGVRQKCLTFMSLKSQKERKKRNRD